MKDKNKDSKKLFIGPSEESWFKFKIAWVVWKLTRDNPIPLIRYIPGIKKLAVWSFKVRVMSRDFEVKED
jgi:hypothetical protein